MFTTHVLTGGLKECEGITNIIETSVSESVLAPPLVR
jgi:hypothetical protein